MSNLIALRLSLDLDKLSEARLNKAQKAALKQVLRDCNTLLDEQRRVASMSEAGGDGDWGTQGIPRSPDRLGPSPHLFKEV